VHKFFISGFKINSLGEDMKKQARRAAHKVEGDEEVILTCGPFQTEDKFGKTASRFLTRHELIFGLKGFGGLASWVAWEDNTGTGEVRVDFRAKMLGCGWAIDFVREVIFEAGWSIIMEY